MPFMDMPYMPYMPQGLLRSAVQGQAGADPARTQQPTFRDVSQRPQQPVGLQDLLKGLIGAGIDPARLGLQGMFGQQQQPPQQPQQPQQQPTFRDISHRPQQPTFSSRRPKPMSPFFQSPSPWRPPTGGP